ncbi:MAG: helix-turn-helix domain-containing protein [Bacteroidales bacterium]|jgi:excisionase family DNA binding protein
MSSNIEVQRICEYCGKEFTARTTKTRFCSHHCNRRAYKKNLKKTKIEISNNETRQIIIKPIEELKTKPFLSISETCLLLGISRRTIYRLLEQNKFSASKIGKRIIIKRTEIDNLLTKNKI